jgi:hypothetical protein
MKINFCLASEGRQASAAPMTLKNDSSASASGLHAGAPTETRQLNDLLNDLPVNPSRFAHARHWNRDSRKHLMP